MCKFGVRLTATIGKQRRLQSKNGGALRLEHIQILDDSNPVPGNMQASLGNMVNKQHLIGLLSAHLEHAGVAVIHAAEEGDADVVIVRKAI